MISTDLSGKTFGLLTVIERDIQTQKEKNSKDTFWKCRCDCGNAVSIRRSVLISGKTKSCGCLYSKAGKSRQDENFKKEIGKTYNNLTILKDTGKRNTSGQRIVECKCSCGKIVEYDLPHIKNGHYKSCGHKKEIKNIIGQKFDKLIVVKLLYEKALNDPTYECQCDCGKTCYRRYSYLMSNKDKSCGCNKRINIIGQKFGLLIAEKELQNNKIVCQCQCGNQTIVNKNNLINSHTKSCGCLKSFGEYQIEKFLVKNKINYKKEFSFNDLKDKDFLRFDFAIFDDKDKLIKLIECNGQQHYYNSNNFHTEALIKHDKMKRDYCLKNNIKLIIIDYL